MDYLFICVGNQGRSQIAEAYFNHLFPSMSCMSAGIRAKHAGEPVHSLVKRIMAEEDIDISTYKIKNLTQEMADSSRIIVSMCDDNPLPEYMSGRNILKWDIPDPKNQGREFLINIRDEIKSQIRQLK